MAEAIKHTLSEYTTKKLADMNISEIAMVISKNWRQTAKDGRVHPYAKPYLDAMMCCETLDSAYVAEDCRTQVIYFLSNASYWKGDVAKEVKLHLNKLLKGK